MIRWLFIRFFLFWTIVRQSFVLCLGVAYVTFFLCASVAFLDFQNSKLDRPICYDLDGKDGEVLSLYEFKQGGTELNVSGQLVASPR